MKDNWSLKDRIITKMQYLTDDKQFPVGEYQIYEPKDVETLRKKLIDDMIDAYVEKTIDPTIDFTKSIVDTINKRFGIDEK